MKKGIINKKSILSATTILAIGGMLVLLFGFINREFETILCKGVDISIDYNQSECLIYNEDITMVLENRVDTFEGRPMGSLDLDALEEQIRMIPFVEEAHMYASLKGKISTHVKQRRPIVRIYSTSGNHHYLDMHGIAVPTISGRPARVLVVNGNIRSNMIAGASVFDVDESMEALKYDFLQKIFLLADYICKDELLRAQIDQVFVQNEEEILMIPKLGKHIIEFGGTENYEWKFRKLVSLYRDGFGLAEWNSYKKINLKYDNQVVCTKR